MSGEADLQKMIESLMELGTLNTRAAPDVAKAIQAILVENDRKHVDPYGVPWPTRKADGAPALDGAEKVLFVQAIDNAIWMRIKGPYARHHLGKAKAAKKKHIARVQIPNTPKLPTNINDAITRVLIKHFNETVQP